MRNQSAGKPARQLDPIGHPRVSGSTSLTGKRSVDQFTAVPAIDLKPLMEATVRAEWLEYDLTGNGGVACTFADVISRPGERIVSKRSSGGVRPIQRPAVIQQDRRLVMEGSLRR